MKKYQLLYAHILILSVFILPTFVSSAPIVVDCGGVENPCEYNDLVQLGQNILSAMVFLSIMVAVVIIAQVGFRMITNGDNSGIRTEAKTKLKKVFVGLAWVIGAWFVVNALLSVLLKDEFILVK